MHRKKSQVAIEYMMLVSIVLVMIMGFSYYFFSQKEQFEHDAMEAKVDYIGNRVSKLAEEAYYSIGPYRKTLNVQVPEKIERIYVHDKKYLVFETDDGETYVYQSDSPMYGYVEGSEAHSGQVIIEKVGDKAVICTGLECKCYDSEIGYCGDLVDNDCDGQIDHSDSEC